MDLSFPRPDPTDPAAGEVTLPPADAAALRDVLREQLADQPGEPAVEQASGAPGAAPTGAFNAAMAARLRAWR